MRNKDIPTVLRLLEHARYEVLPTPTIEGKLLEAVPTDVQITVTASPSKGLGETLATVERLSGHGYDVVHGFEPRPCSTLPALLARSLRHATYVADWADLWGPAGMAADWPAPQRASLGAFDGRWQDFTRRQADAVTSFGDLPLIVVSRGRDLKPDWQVWQADLLHLSSKSQQLIADQSGHNVQLEQPAAAVGAIVEMVEQIRRQAGQ